jgi:hypothetical protein
MHSFIMLAFLCWDVLTEYALWPARAALAWMAIYTVLALRRVYGASWLVTAMRSAVLYLLELKCLAILVGLAFYLTLC